MVDSFLMLFNRNYGERNNEKQVISDYLVGDKCFVGAKPTCCVDSVDKQSDAAFLLKLNDYKTFLFYFSLISDINWVLKPFTFFIVEENQCFSQAHLLSLKASLTSEVTVF